ncbi:hypothetical protein BFU36_11120 [Sulfolobus sp. A20]|uniref:hypothetical protein n=1 Tax=Sulfolobaceae TaxID=118883 RepID=UPI000845C842|nr:MULTISPECIES: hypothetical protein [unclassified Sulfolobus]TRM73913.1 hypothetical protein DJ532_14125 [Sulfolobus sp. A20-N-F8]TRM74425.1 hypothetical protein DJ528_10400 [Sulfolobus sp. B5]TRM83973.1 hypothetical protein DJ531_02740 [Sulfolobus sp. A20-N-F6]TRM86394.1 hypothetical protein DJ529_11400 [Sulfolobus sp. C3]TRM97340.1 hypothetical protein DJ530_12185 [Sulfolobus sp. E1]
MVSFIVRFEEDDDKWYLISDSGIISRIPNKENFDILIVRNLSEEKVKIAMREGYRLFECKERNGEECLIKLLNVLFPYCKTCKFS